jgi:hypothetical protein
MMRSAPLRKVGAVGVVVAGLRLTAFGILLGLRATSQERLSALPLVLLLYPEGLLVPQTIDWTVWTVVGFGALLAAGSVLWVAIALWIVGLMGRRPG